MSIRSASRAIAPTTPKKITIWTIGVGALAWLTARVYFGPKSVDNSTGKDHTMSTDTKATTGATSGSTANSKATDDNKVPAQAGPADALIDVTDQASATRPSDSRLRPRPAPTTPASTDTTHDGPGLINAAQSGPKPGDQKSRTTDTTKVPAGSQP